MFAPLEADLTEAKHKKGFSKKGYALLFILFLVSLLVFSLFWSDRSFYNEDNTQSQSQIVNGTYYSHRTTVFTVENYIPLRAYTLRPKIANYFYSNQTNGEVANSPEALQVANVSINYVEVEFFYGETVLQLPIRDDCPPYFYEISAFPMAKTVITYDWEFNITYSPVNYYSINLIPQEDRLGKLPIFSFEMFAKISSKFVDVIYCFVFIGIGIVLSWTLLRKQQKLKNAYKYLTNEFPQQPDKLRPNLDVLSGFQDQLGIIEGLTLGLSIIFLRISVSNWCKKHLHVADSHNKKQLSNFIKESDVGLSDLVPNLRFVLVGLGFLASVGISFSWNIIALTPFLLSVVALYFFLNIGSTMFLLRESRKDLLWVLVILIVALLVLFLPSILDSLRLVT